MSKEKQKLTKHDEYASLILSKIGELLDDTHESDFHLSLEELGKDDNMTHFIHAFATLAPNLFFNKVTGETKNSLEFNHICNEMVFQFIKINKE